MRVMTPAQRREQLQSLNAAEIRDLLVDNLDALWLRREVLVRLCEIVSELECQLAVLMPPDDDEIFTTQAIDPNPEPPF